MPGYPLSSSATPFAALPPFPNDIDTAPLFRVSLAKLLAHDDAESKRVLGACKTQGFFYLDLTDTAQGHELENESEQVVAVAKETFDLPLDEKLEYLQTREGPMAGYKAQGTKAAHKDAKPDTTEFLNVAKDHVHGILESRIYPPPIEAAFPLLRSFSANAHAIGCAVLEVLAIQMGLPSATFSEANNINMTSGDHVRLTKKTPHHSDSGRIGLTAHTDFGSITLLFNWLGGLQIKSKSRETLGQWEYVKPLPGHAICNLGDAMVKFTSGELKSAKHRVVTAPGEQADVDRYSVVYFVRPADDVPLKAMYGSQVGQEEESYTAKEWIGLRMKELQSETAKE